jgi:hypothetical protein
MDVCEYDYINRRLLQLLEYNYIDARQRQLVLDNAVRRPATSTTSRLLHLLPRQLRPTPAHCRLLHLLISASFD